MHAGEFSFYYGIYIKFLYQFKTYCFKYSCFILPNISLNYIAKKYTTTCGASSSIINMLTIKSDVRFLPRFSLRSSLNSVSCLEPSAAGTCFKPFGAGTSLEPFGAGTSLEPFSAGTSLEPFFAGTCLEPFFAGTHVTSFCFLRLEL